MSSALLEGRAAPSGQPASWHGQPTSRRLQRGGGLESLFFMYVPFTTVVLLTWAHSPDDAFITLRYATNLLHGHGPVFNIGERVQGFSSPLHLLVSVLIVALPGGAVLLKAKLLSIFFGFLALQRAASSYATLT